MLNSKAQEIVPVETITCDPNDEYILVHAKGEETCPAGYYYPPSFEVCTGDDGRCEEVSRPSASATTSVEDLLPGTLYQYIK
ncbi:hypothetical protein SPFM10_00093 [Salmonella phage SPFM10]|nr:hypothetical protein SPFM10_00093 [Salmonella phage SPFM10]